MRKVLIACFIAMFSVNLSAVQYELKEGGEHELCRDYVSELNSSKQKLPMACERRFSADSKRFSKPAWEPMNPKNQPLQLFREMYDLRKRAFDKKTKTDTGWEWYQKEVLMPAIEWDSIDLDKGFVDINNDGSYELVLRIRVRRGIGGCEAETEKWFHDGEGVGPEEYEYFVMNAESGHLDENYGTLVLTGDYHDVFVYKGRTYLDDFVGISTKVKNMQSTGLVSKECDSPEGTITVLNLSGPPSRFGASNMCLIFVCY